MKLDNFLQKIIVFCFSLLFFLVPIFFTSVTSELFEFNKIVLIYFFTALIGGAWLGRMILQKKLIFKKSFLDIPLVLFLASQTISTIFSINPRTSIFGYYSRFNGGLLSTFCYMLLYWSMVSNCNSKNVLKFIKTSLITAFVVSIYGIFEHFGHSFSCLLFEGNFNVSCWVQDVQNRVFATLGQPNWLAAYLIALTPITWALMLMSNVKCQMSKPSLTRSKLITKNFLIPLVLSVLMFSCLLFTDSRSGFLGLILSAFVFWTIMLISQKNNRKPLIKPFFIVNCTLLIVNFIFGTPFPQINKYFSFQSLKSHFSLQIPASHVQPPTSPTDTQIVTGGTESGAIRKIVWQGAVEIFKNYPLFGSGVETFAYSYYNYRPIEHNLVSEWDFLYNKAHNEYLNYLATTGILGLGTYLFFIVSVIFYSLKFSILNFKFSNNFKIFDNKNKEKSKKDVIQRGFAPMDPAGNITLTLFSGWITLLVTNFFGFSVVVTSLYFFTIPAFIFILSQSTEENPFIIKSQAQQKIPALQLILLLLVVLFLLNKVINYWLADYYYSRGEKFDKAGQYYLGYEELAKAIKLTPKESVYYNELSSSTASLAYLTKDAKDASSTAELVDNASRYSDYAVKLNPVNLNLWKNRVKVYYTLSTIEPNFLETAIDSALTASKLAPTDPKIVYNLGLLYGKKGDNDLAIKTIQKAIELKPNYADARNGLALYYEDLKLKDKAIEQLQYIFKYIDPNSQDVKARLEKLQK